MKWRRLLLLLVRSLCVLTLAAAFARPLWHASRIEASAAAVSNAMVILLDGSASMRQTNRNGVSQFDLAKGGANRWLAELRPGRDVAEIILMNEQPRAILGQLSGNLPLLKQELADLPAGYDRANSLAALRLAGELLRDHSGPRHVVICSDWQATTWRDASEVSLPSLLPAGTQISLLDAASGENNNVSVFNVHTEPTQPLVQQATSIVAELVNHSDVRRQVRVSAKGNMENLPAQTVDLAPNERREIMFAYRPTDLTPIGIEVTADQDGFTVDDRAVGVLRATSGLPVAILSDDDMSQVGSSGYYLNLALAPFGDRNDRFTILPMKSRDVATADLRKQGAILVGYLGELDAANAQMLSEYVRTGGAAIIFCGQGPVRRNLQTLDSCASGGWLPWVTGPRQDLERDPGFTFIDSGRWSSRLLKEFDVTSQIALREIPFSTFWNVEQVRGDTEVLLTFANGVPALARRPFESGQIVLANFSPASDAGELGKHGVFVALAQILAQQLGAATNARPSLTIGDSWVAQLPVDASMKDVKLDCDGQLLQDVLIASRDTWMEVTYHNTVTPGIYRITSDRACLDAFAVNVDPAECDLARVDMTLLRETLGGSNAVPFDAPSTNWDSSLHLQGVPLERYLIVAALSLVAAEMGLLGWWRR